MTSKYPVTTMIVKTAAVIAAVSILNRWSDDKADTPPPPVTLTSHQQPPAPAYALQRPERYDPTGGRPPRNSRYVPQL